MLRTPAVFRSRYVMHSAIAPLLVSDTTGHSSSKRATMDATCPAAVINKCAMVAAAFVVPRLHLGIVTPLIRSSSARIYQFANTAPIFGWWDAHVGWGTPFAILIGLLAVVWGPTLAQRLPWRALTLTASTTSAAWAFSLAMIDGWQGGFAGRLPAKHEYLRQVPTVTDIPEALRNFARRIPDFQPDSWIPRYQFPRARC